MNQKEILDSPEAIYKDDCRKNDKFMLILSFSHLPWIIIFAYQYGTLIHAFSFLERHFPVIFFLLLL